MSITSMADRRISVVRRTGYLLEAAPAAAANSVSRQPARASHIEVATAGHAGTVTVTGTVGGAPDSEVLTFTGSAPLVAVTTKLFTAIAAGGIAVTGALVGTNITVSAVGSGGERRHVATLIAENWPARKDAGRASWGMETAGGAERANTRFFVDYTTAWEPREGDVIIDHSNGDREWLVVGDPRMDGGGLGRPHHWEIRVERSEGRSLA